MNHGLNITLVVTFGVGFVMAALLGLSSKLGIKRTDNAFVLEYGIHFKVIPYVSFIAAIAFPVLMSKQATQGFYVAGIWEYAAVVSFFLLLGIALFIEFNFSKIYITDSGVSRESLWGGKKDMRWSDIKAVKLGMSNEYIIATGDNRKLRISVMLTGVQEFLKTLEQKTGLKPARLHK